MHDIVDSSALLRVLTYSMCSSPGEREGEERIFMLLKALFYSPPPLAQGSPPPPSFSSPFRNKDGKFTYFCKL